MVGGSPVGLLLFREHLRKFLGMASQRTSGVLADAAYDGVERAREPDGHAVIFEQLEVSGMRGRAATESHHGGAAASNGADAFGDGGCFHVAKGGLAQIVEDAGDRALLKGFDLFVDIDEVPSEAAG